MDVLVQYPIIRIVLLLLIFAATVWCIYTGVEYAQAAARTRQSLRHLSHESAVADGDSNERLMARSSGAWWRLVETIERSGLSLSDSDPGALRRRLVAAGFESPEAPRLYTLIRLVLVFLLPVGTLAWMIGTGAELTFFRLYIVGSILGVVGLLGPSWFLRWRASSRHQAVVNGFPNCLDLMLVCVEAGLGLEAALDRIGREMAEAEPHVSRLLVRTTLQLRAGASREQAFQRLGEMSGVDEVRSFATLLIQSDKLGTSIADTLRTFASEMRERRRMRAEEKAHRLPVLISVPLIVCMLPTMVGVLMLPAFIAIVRRLIPLMTGG